MGASESKLAFKEDIFRLAGEDNISPRSDWWDRFIQLPEAPDDVQALWSPNDLRNLTHAGPSPNERPPPGAQVQPMKNVETLIYRCVDRLIKLQTTRYFSDPHTPIAPQVLNCLRILTRLLPYIYEAKHLNEWEDRFFWQPRRPTSVWKQEENKHSPLFDGLNPKADLPKNEAFEEQELGMPLGVELTDILLKYLFFPGFTLPPKKEADGLPSLKPTATVWQSGIGAKNSVGMTRENEKNAVEVLRLLVTLASKPMYITPDVVAETDIRPLTYLTTQSDRSMVLNVLCSLLNTVLKYSSASWGFPMEITGYAKVKLSLVTYSLQFLLVLVQYSPPFDETNEFRKQLSRLHRPEDFQFVVEGLRQILMEPASGVLRLTRAMSPIATETLSLFWELLQCNKRFRSYLSDTGRAMDFVVLILFYTIEAKSDPAKQGIMRECVFILQTMSVEEKFGKKLNEPFTLHETLPATVQIPNFHGSYADFLIGHLHHLLTSGVKALDSLHPALLAIIVNIGPYVERLERATSSMLIDIFARLAAPSFLLANDTNHCLLLQMLDAINAILEHKRSENQRFVEVLVKSHRRFEALRNFTVERALAEVDRMAMERKDRAASESAGIRSPVRNGSIDSVRSPVSARSPRPSLGGVPENATFAIGDDDDEEGMTDSQHGLSTPTSASASVEDAVPKQSRSMSEKARGKQPIGQGSFSRSTSRNSSHASLSSLNTHHANISFTGFTPTAEWLHTWLPFLPLHSILRTIDSERQTAFTQRRATDPTLKPPPPLARNDSTYDPAAPPRPEIKLQAFQWTTLSLGWYTSLLWSLIYASDLAHNKGSTGIWTGTNIRLFTVKAQRSDITLRSPKGAVDAVGNTIAARLGSLSFGGGGGGGGTAGPAPGSAAAAAAGSVREV